MIAEQKIEARPRNWLTPVALVILREESSYGYELVERLEEFGFEKGRNVVSDPKADGAGRPV